MIASAKVRHIRMSARKVRLVIDLIRGKTTQNALTILANTKKRASMIIDKLLRSAIANAKNKGAGDVDLYISQIFADVGQTWKRFRSASFGRGTKIRKRTCHITIELDKKTVIAKNIMPVKKNKETEVVTKV